jgi:hypothetical protein
MVSRLLPLEHTDIEIHEIESSRQYTATRSPWLPTPGRSDERRAPSCEARWEETLSVCGRGAAG